ncbi:hypothetical protein EC957_012205 [Mortierella hygrophila]|uniref:Ser-Thr-rich glycosyl-phosphatidyl-inositol-anchored membrane family-domain-containing protein n=1 Tax=Mortierella hygrophila TaxID=979708 RepID=A0A9P6K3B9_9FUNG|nr:hypothetical protein EC957_012205 [Mortierella hygrophila]
MKSTTLIAATLALSAASVAAQSSSSDDGRLFYSSPISPTVWTSGKNETVSWTNACKPGNKESLSIVLYMNSGRGSDTEQVRVPGIRALGTLNCLKSKTATVFIPENIVTGTTYSIHVNTVPLQSYSAQFTINGVAPPPTPSTTGAVGEGEGVVGTASATADVVAPTAATTTGADVVAPTVTDLTAAENENSASKMTFSAGVAVVAAVIGSFFL